VKRRRAQPIWTPPAPEPDPVLPPTTWTRPGRILSPQHIPFNIRQIVDGVHEGEFLLPPFQRPYVWTPEQAIRLFDSLRRGYHVGSLLLWERWGMTAREVEIGGVQAMSGTRVHTVLDGHQRTASVVWAATSPRCSFDLLSGALLVDAAPGPWVVPAGAVLGRMSNHVRTADWLFHEAPAHAATYEIDPRALQRLVLGLCAVFERAYISAVRLDADYALPDVVEMYRRLNTEGTRHTAEDLERALAAL
jgi:hypothetical protein